MRLYVASSWRNRHQQPIVRALRDAGHSVYDFMHPDGGDHRGFSWAEIDPEWRTWDRWDYAQALQHPVARAGFASDFGAMQGADACVLVLPAGRSAHLEAGWFAGSGRRLVVFVPPEEPAGNPDLMYLIAGEDGRLAFTIDEILRQLEPAGVPA